MLNYVLPIEIVYSALISNFALTLCSMRQVICCVALVDLDDDSLDIAPCTLPIAGECADVGLTAYMSSFELRMACLLTSVRTIFLTLDWHFLYTAHETIITRITITPPRIHSVLVIKLACALPFPVWAIIISSSLEVEDPIVVTCCKLLYFQLTWMAGSPCIISRSSVWIRLLSKTRYHLLIHLLLIRHFTCWSFNSSLLNTLLNTALHSAVSMPFYNYLC